MVNTDLHIHSCLSPCADAGMTPYELVSAAKRAGLDLIALTDHNSTRNCPAAAEAAEELHIGFIPGIEVTTLEEIHCICLFPDLGKAAAFSRWLDTLLPELPGRRRGFGPAAVPSPAQRKLEERQLFYMARRISVSELPAAAQRYHGLCWPAHVEKPYNSLFTILGVWPPELEADAAELFSSDAAPPGIPNGVRTIRVSDAHHLWDIQEGGFPLPLESPDFAGLEKYLRSSGEI